MNYEIKGRDWKSYTTDFTTKDKKIYYVKVEKTCYAYLNIEAEDEQKAKELAESYKNHFVLDWK